MITQAVTELANAVSSTDGFDTRASAIMLSLREATACTLAERRAAGSTDTTLPETAEPPIPSMEDGKLMASLMRRLGAGDITAVAPFKVVKRRMVEYEIHCMVSGLLTMGEAGVSAAIKAVGMAYADDD